MDLTKAPNHSQTTTDIYKPSRSPLPSAARYPYPSSPQLQQTQATISQVQVSAQRYSASAAAAVYTGNYREYRAPRISLLHPEYAASRARETLPGGAGIVHLDSISGQQPIKKIRLQDHKDSLQPLRIDTRVLHTYYPFTMMEQPGTYNPQVEAISPTLPDHQEDQAFRTTKDELIQQIGKVDREIAKAESQIIILKKKQQELEELANKPSVKPEVEEDTQPEKHQSLPQKIYAENRKKAQSAHGQLDALGAKVEWPLYNQPSDTSVYVDNKRKHVAFKKRLLEYFKRRHAEKDSRNSFLTETYSKLMQEWLRKVDKIESSTKRKAKEAKNREFFEKVFPELRKQREDKERFNRVGARVKSEADMEEIMDNLQEQAMEDKKMRSYAVIPPILLDARQRKICYMDDNGFIEDMKKEYNNRLFLNVWTSSEKEIFKEKYLQHPKNFGVIASCIERKSVSDCVQYYYHSKKKENYKQLLRKSRQRTRAARNNTQKVNNSANATVIDILTTGVTTRLQREQQQQQRTVVQPPREQSTPEAASSVALASEAPGPLLSTSPTGSILAQPHPPPGSPQPGAPANAPTPPTVISSTGAPVLTVAASVVTSTAGRGDAQPNSPKAADNAATITVETTGVATPGCKTFSDFNSFEEFRAGAAAAAAAATTTTVTANNQQPQQQQAVAATGGKFFGDDAKGDGSATAADAAHEGVVITAIKKETEPSAQDTCNATSSDQNVTSASNSTALSETKKKKERRKDKENTSMESSDDDAAGLQDKSAQGACLVCSSQLGPQLHSRPLLSSQAVQYGLREDQVPPNGRICNTCRCKNLRVRHQNSHCPLPTCPNPRGRVKRLRSLPQRLQDMPPELREPILGEFRVPSGVTKCCCACFNRIQRRLGPPEEWSEEEVGQLKQGLTEVGANWQLLGEKLGKSAQQVRSFYAANRKRHGLEACLGDRKPTLTDEEESGSSTSSCELPMCDRHSSDTASAAESPPVAPNQTSIGIKKEDYDSSATETADEAQTPDHYQTATITPVTNDGGAARPNSPLSVKDLVLNVIEFSLMKNPGGGGQNPPTGGMAPTISSILNNDSNEVTIVSEYNLNAQQRPQSLAKLVTPLIGATITPVPAPQQQQQPPPQQLQDTRDDLVVVSVQDSRLEPETLDLSIKKPRELPPPAHIKLAQQQQQQQQHQLHPRPEHYLYHTQERKSPAFTLRPQMPSPKPANPKSGSITLGTPIITQPRYEGLLRQMAPETKMGSITQGTPIHMPQHMQEKRVYDYLNKRGGNVSQQQQQQQQQQYVAANAAAQYRQQAYTVEQQLSSRQVIMNDYITSQQMLSRRGGGDKPQYYSSAGAAAAAGSPHRTPPPPPAQQVAQQRQGVIQRHNTQRPQYLPPGHEALSSLVDVAVQQPSLPVPPNAPPPPPHEGLGKTIADNIMEQPHRFQIIQQQHQMRQHQQQQQQHHQQHQQHHQQQQQHQQQVRLEEQRRAYAAQQARAGHAQRQGGDSSTLTAASLIDAIITHQINQTAEGGREMVANSREPPRAGDLLFQSFHRDPPPPQQQPPSENNGDRPPSVISIDLDAEPIGKNLTVKELTDSVISHDFSGRPPPQNYYHHAAAAAAAAAENEKWKRRGVAAAQQQQQQHEAVKRSGTPQQQQDERQIIRIAQPQVSQHQQLQQQQQPKYHMEPVSPPDNHWGGGPDGFRRFDRPPQSQHISALDYVKNKIVEVMRTEDDKKSESYDAPDKERSDSPGDMVIDEEATQQQQQPPPTFNYAYVQHKDSTPGQDSARNNEPKPLLSSKYDPLSDED